MGKKMTIVNVHEAKTHLSKLLQRVSGGEQIVIARAGKPLARLVAFESPVADRIAGTAAGEIRMSPDFDDPLPDELLDAFEGRS
jgi:prevent-host-death family protein